MKAGSLAHLPEISEEAQRVFRASHEIPPDWHIRTQGAFQEFTDNAVSKTINLPNSATRAEVEHAYLMAYQLKCLGITVFRDGCLDQQVLNVGVGNDTAQKISADKVKTEKPEESPKVKPRPYKRLGATMSKATPFGTAHITMNDDEDGPAEVFISIGKAGTDVMAMAEGYGRSISLYLRTESTLSRVEKVKEYVSQLRGIGGSRSVGFGDARVASLPDAIARAMAEHWLIDVQTPVLSSGDGLVNENGGNRSPKLTGNLCPECGGMTLAREEGCQKCYSCGFSEC